MLIDQRTLVFDEMALDILVDLRVHSAFGVSQVKDDGLQVLHIGPDLDLGIHTCFLNGLHQLFYDIILETRLPRIPVVPCVLYDLFIFFDFFLQVEKFVHSLSIVFMKR